MVHKYSCHKKIIKQTKISLKEVPILEVRKNNIIINSEIRGKIKLKKTEYMIKKLKEGRSTNIGIGVNPFGEGGLLFAGETYLIKKRKEISGFVKKEIANIERTQRDALAQEWTGDKGRGGYQITSKGCQAGNNCVLYI